MTKTLIRPDSRGVRGDLLDRALARLQRPIDVLYVGRHPGTVARALIRLAAPLVRRMKPNDRWSLGVHAAHWADVCGLPPIEPRPAPLRIFMFAAYRGQFSMELPLASLLAWRGHRVTVGWLPKLRSSIKPPLEDHPSAHRYLSASLAGLSAACDGRVASVDLTAYVDRADVVSEKFVSSQAAADARFALGRETDAEGDPEMERLRAYFARTGRFTQSALSGFMAEHRADFDLALIPNGTTFESAHVCEVLRHYNLPFNTMEKFAFRHIRVMSHGNDFRSFSDLDAVWKRREELGYVGAYRDFAVGMAMDLMNQRRKSSTAAWVWVLQNAPDQDADATLRDAGVDATKPFALVCTTVPWDAGYDKLCAHFPSMRAWLIRTVKVLIERTSLQVVVRVHPSENSHYGGKERSEDNLRAAGFVPSARLVIIPSTQQINTYGLMERCKFGAVFSSGTGLEMAMMGRRVLVGAEIYYGRRGFTTDIVDATDYDQKLVALAAESGNLDIEPERAKDAALFHFMLHYVTQWPFPYDKGGEVQVYPPAELVRSGAIRQWLQTLDALATLPREFDAQLPRFLSVAQCGHVPKPG